MDSPGSTVEVALQTLHTSPRPSADHRCYLPAAGLVGSTIWEKSKSIGASYVDKPAGIFFGVPFSEPRDLIEINGAADF